MIILAPISLFLFNFVPADPYQDFASDFGTVIEWRQETDCGEGANGCYRSDEPDTIQIRSGMLSITTLGVVQHELAHVVINRQCGWEATTNEEAVEAYADINFSEGLTYGNGYMYDDSHIAQANIWSEGGC